MNKYIAEFIGTFFLFSRSMHSNRRRCRGARSLSHRLRIMSRFLRPGHISGGHSIRLLG